MLLIRFSLCLITYNIKQINTIAIFARLNATVTAKFSMKPSFKIINICSVSGPKPVFGVSITLATTFVALRVRAMVFNATFNNILVILWRSIFLVEVTRVPGENHQPATDH